MKKSGLWLLAPVALMMMAASGPVMAAEPSVRDVYATARAGQVDKAITMMDEVIKAHPNSAKAHYVQAELMARQSRMADARSQLATAEKLAPGLPGIQPQSVAALKAQVNGTLSGPAATQARTVVVPQPERRSGFPWMTAIIIGALGFGLLAFLRRRNQASEVYQPPMGGGYNAPYGGNGYGPQGGPGFGGGYGGGFGQSGGMGSSILGGLATGAAAGVGFAAGERIVDGLFGDHEKGGSESVVTNNAWAAPAPDLSNSDMGGNDFGITDDSSWDSGGDDGGDW
jgi:hypothetical protein